MNINKSKNIEGMRVNRTAGKRNILYAIIIIIIVIVIAVFFKIKNNSSSSSSNANSNKSSSLKFAELAYENKERLWFSFTGFENSPNTDAVNTKLSRNAQVSNLYVTKNGYITEYSADTFDTDNDSKMITVDDINKYSDKKIIERFKELDKINFDNKLKAQIDQSNSLSQTAEASEYQAMKYSAPKAGKITISAMNDGTSNKVTNEKISGIYTWTWGKYNDADQQHNDDGSVKSPIKFEPESYKKESLTIGVAKGNEPLAKNNVVDNINFAGFGGNFLTRIDKKQSLKFDSYKDKHVNKSTSNNN